jgi:asparagine synthase (glutamine-hydrolysing)
MCGIVAILDIAGDAAQLRTEVLAMARRLRHRGPDWSGIAVYNKAVIGHERLAIVGVDSGAQPLYSNNRQVALGVNGEIYNHQHLRQNLASNFSFQTHSDCEVILALYEQQGADAAEQWLNELNGMFAFVLYDEAQDHYLIARDPIGIIPLYYGRDDQGRLYVASEMKSLVDHCQTVSVFPPGHYLDSRHGEIKPYYQPNWKAQEHSQNDYQPERLREGLENAVKRQMMGDVPYGVLLSGGLDSSLVAAIAQRYAERRVDSDDQEAAWWPRLHSFAIGLKGSPDLAASRVAAERLGTAHHEFEFTLDEGLDALSDVIYHIETYDVTTIRASTPMFLLARRIRAMGIKMVLSGEGSDELFGGYLYFHKAPNAQAFHEETVRKVEKLHLYDCLRANKSMAAWGVEARVPFLDLPFVDMAMKMDAQHKMTGPERMEKHVLRQAFDGYLPDSILWRQKEQFSDGVGYGWIDALKDHAAAKVSDRQLAEAEQRFPVNPPQSKEAYWYRTIFEQHFPSAAAAATVPGGPSVACSTPAALEWDRAFAEMADPSGRAVRDVHSQSL